MTRFRLVARALALILALIAWPALADTLGPPTQHLAMRLVAESAHPRAGAPLTIAIDTRPERGWHGYWQNPGDAGFPARFGWTLPKGMTAGEARYPVPGTLLVAGLMNYVYEAPYAPLVPLQVPAGLATGTPLPIRLKLDYLVCTDTICVPEEQTLALDLTVGDGAVDPAARGAFDGWRRAIPHPLDAVAHYAVGKDGAVRIAVPYPAAAAVTNAYFFPLTAGAIDYAAPQTVSRDGDTLTIATRGKAATGPIDGVLRIGAGQGLAVHAVPGAIGADTGAAAPAQGVLLATLVAFAGAVLGGLILNIMPCVFPILSLKALSLARGNTDARTARHDALAYTAGVVLVLLALGGAILALRAGGSAIGWAFQLQDPRAIVVLLLLSVAISLNLSGLFEVPMPRFAGNSGVSGSFATGALAAFVATPCTGPFMGAALGAALVLPWPAALAVFGGLGLGLSLPFLAVGFVPALRRRLPKPGAWMETFRRILSVPMWLTAIALAWVLGRQSGVDAQSFALLVALLLGFVLWWAGTRQRRGEAAGIVLALGLIAVLAIGVAALPKAQPRGAEAVAGTTPFSEAKLAELRKANRPVFAYFTADWCLTCKVNEKAAIETAGVQAAFRQHKVAVLLGDWTDGDAVLGRFIQAHNRAGVPLYLYYAPGAAEPRVLPQVLTPGMLATLGE
ncbi:MULTISPECIES: protein-disulfide reductase DsbD domain-containing protein [unclassified Sphingomonas]|uniref:protein-disulfide reductase DsbD family protein n=1 Tax=unclassified Sphingomonas TaxID=196159 RepID=UPI002269D755|nr:MULTISPECIES: protein-disulfide reductase DsbD domain-containing protein [unclassified Sphingomonas]